jgi:glycosyltransferase involved in cell wall biosynthesis
MIGALLIRSVDAAIVHSSGAADAVTCAFRCDRARLRIVPHGHYIDWYPNTISKAAAREALGIPGDHLVFLYFGAIRKYKQVPALVKAFREFNVAKSTLLICGSPSYDARVDALGPLNCEGSSVVTKLGFIEDRDVQLYFNASDAVVLPIGEALTSGSVFLAMSFGRAVITPQIAPMTAALPDSGAIFYAPGVPGALTEALERAPSSDLVSMGQRNLEHVRCNNDWGTIGRQTREVYESLR